MVLLNILLRENRGFFILRLRSFRKRIARRMDYRLLPASPGAPCPRDALRVCRLLKLDDALMELFQADL